ncbi:mRNA-capping enzyme subunit beta [Boothiomyces sp. JEL0866]|nr:mRNA-capping enzyme subunit beta [Boothiomyces sp. JEL0866]KAJ3324551.1 mRNA-capping enzyme subunit beta [Boothiomyces sp. JEL0866]
MSNLKRTREEGIPIPPSVFSIRPVSEITLQVTRFLSDAIQKAQRDMLQLNSQQHIKSSQIEVEAKLGQLFEKRSQMRYSLPIRSETILENPRDTYFKSDMTMQQHAHYNQVLNGLVQNNKNMRYKHTRECDQFANCQFGKVRQTLVEDKLKEIIIKTRVADLNVFIPSMEFDYRISVNIESITNLEQQSNVFMSRYKDRLSYKLYPFQVDLTQVKSNGSTTHELEIEFDVQEFIPDLVDQSSKGIECIDSLLNSIRILIGKLKAKK